MADRRQVDAVVAAVREVLGEALVGAYLYGSAVLSELHPYSDLDVVAIVDRPTSVDERRHLRDACMAASGPSGTLISGRPIELTVVVASRLRPWTWPPEREFQYGEWLRDDYEEGLVPAPTVDHDLAAVIATALTASVALVGPPLETVVDPPDHDRLVAAMLASLPALLADRDTDTVNVLLTLARMWHTIETGNVVSKDEAALWAMGRLPASMRPPLEAARAIYLGL
ncbi:MAG TPA: aminoglycoside adenylyltransferase domain-containing protein [Acidimicrobiia bacterium]